MHIETTGTGPALGLIHGWAMHGGLFAPLVARLRDRYTVHVVDLPGHGHARAHDAPLDPPALAAELVERVPQAAWLGWSLGGQVALHAGLGHPHAVRAVIPVASSPRFVRDADWPHGVTSTLFSGFGEALQRDFRGTLEGFLALEVAGSEHARSELRTLRAHAFERGEPAPRALLEGLALLDRVDLRAALPDLSLPSLWIAGARDRLVPAPAMEAAAALCPRGRCEVIAGAGHAPFVGAPDAVAAAIDVFLQALPAHAPRDTPAP